jgi:hypothetical protein
MALTRHRGAGIIGQPYAFRNAGLLTGTLLLIGLTITVDWTIQLIVINSKLSGTDSFQATVEHCFGKSGLVAISLAQWILYVQRNTWLSGKMLIIQRFWRHGGVLCYCRRYHTESAGRFIPFPVRHVVLVAPYQPSRHHHTSDSRNILSPFSIPRHFKGKCFPAQRSLRRLTLRSSQKPVV